MTTKIIYDYSNVAHHDFAMPIEVIEEDERKLCPSCECELTPTDFAVGFCTQCKFKLRPQRRDDESD